ncbi:MAG: tRNA preQ1(34) S-adenosylmethionine ribosyltransferase-isomerase QueA [Planctomycetaceae bacterium]|nr:tRNA preQ1(34) S-adenosylmethionine ribosyltransferase-isomerase QueA [Planctomycetaceae bacterium]
MSESVAGNKESKPSEMDQYDFPIPKSLIAQTPLPHRADARLMVVNRQSQQIEHRHVRDLPEILSPRDLLVLNDTRVVPAKLTGVRQKTGGRWQGLFLEADPQGVWRLMCKTRGKMELGESITLFDRQGRESFSVVMVARLEEGQWAAVPQLHLLDEESPLRIAVKAARQQWPVLLQEVGQIPLPHYIRGGNMMESDLRDYQTVYAKHPGAVAAPTAGLHFTEEILRGLKRAGIGIGRITLHVGAGTFRPVQAESLDQHVMHQEWCNVDEKSVAQVQQHKQLGGRVIPVGTTSMRSLETAARSGTLQPFCGDTNLFIRPGFQFHVADGLMTNFHLPRTTLIVLVRTFGGDELMKRAYAEAIEREYRFFSYGDSMLIL